MEEAEIPQKLERVLSKSCTQCGSQMYYSAKLIKLHCESCGHTEEPPQENDMIVENCFSEALKLKDAPTGLNIQTKEFHCNNCGANTMVPPDTVSFSCPFCGSKKVNEEAHQQRVITPSGILPFKVDKKRANEKFKNWLGKGIWYPPKLKKLAELEKMDGLYMPFWTYDANTDSSWTAEAGYYYYVTETYTDSSGKTQTRQVRKVRWVPANGYYNHWFDDITVVASGGVKQARVERVYPYDLTEVVNYDSQYLLGWKSEVYQKDVKQGYDQAEKIMDKYIRGQVVKQIPGDTYRNLHINTRKYDITYKHLLLPMYLGVYIYNKKSYQVLVNGQTAAISGQKPISWWKVALAILIVGVVATGIYLLAQ